jgi:hypothetical protein
MGLKSVLNIKIVEIICAALRVCLLCGDTVRSVLVVLCLLVSLY